MRCIPVLSLLLVASAAYADHVWRLWCGDAPIERKGVYDISRECWADATT